MSRGKKINDSEYGAIKNFDFVKKIFATDFLFIFISNFDPCLV